MLQSDDKGKKSITNYELNFSVFDFDKNNVVLEKNVAISVRNYMTIIIFAG